MLNYSQNAFIFENFRIKIIISFFFNDVKGSYVAEIAPKAGERFQRKVLGLASSYIFGTFGCS
ncbi:MAG: hypothetical protein ACTSYB_14490 [Candidatus Helarchaeota archaeon]